MDALQPAQNRWNKKPRMTPEQIKQLVLNLGEAHSAQSSPASTGLPWGTAEESLKRTLNEHRGTSGKK